MNCRLHARGRWYLPQLCRRGAAKTSQYSEILPSRKLSQPRWSIKWDKVTRLALLPHTNLPSKFLFWQEGMSPQSKQHSALLEYQLSISGILSPRFETCCLVRGPCSDICAKCICSWYHRICTLENGCPCSNNITRLYSHRNLIHALLTTLDTFLDSEPWQPRVHPT